MQTNSDTAPQHLLSRRMHSVIVLLCVLLGLSAFTFKSLQSVTYDDDTLFMYFTALALKNPTAAAEADNLVRQHLEQHPEAFSVEAAQRLKFRLDYREAYVLYSAAIAGASLLSPHPPHSSEEVLFSVTSGILAVNVALALLLGLLLRRAAVPSNGLLAVCALLLLTATANLLPLPQYSYRFADWPDVLVFLKKAIGFALNPEFNYNLFGGNARNGFTFLLLGFFLLRLRGLWTLSYALLVFGSLLHVTYGGMMLFFTLAVDALIRPGIFRNNITTSVVLTGGALFVLREKLLSSFALGAPLLLGAAAVLLLCLLLRCPLIGLMERCRVKPVIWLRQTAPIKADTVCFAALAALIVLGAYALRHSDPDAMSAKYIWSELASRSLGLLRIPVLLGLLLLSVEALQKFKPRMHTALPALLLVAGLIVSSINLASAPFSLPRAAPHPSDYSEIGIFKALCDYLSGAPEALHTLFMPRP